VLQSVDTSERIPPLVDEETFWAVHRLLTDPKRRTRLGPRTGRYLLTALARCDVCGGKLAKKMAPANSRRTEFVECYSCRERSCVGIPVAGLDEYVEQVIVAWLSDPATAADLAETTGDSAAARQARGDAERGRAELQQLYADVKAGLVSSRLATIDETRLLAAIGDAEWRVQEATLPPVLVGNVGPQARAGWDALDIDARRLIIRTVADIRVRRVGRGWKVPVRDRVEWRWLLTDGNGHGDGHDAEVEESTGDPLADHIGEALAQAGPEGLTRKADLWPLVGGIPKERLDAALAALEASGRAVRSTRANRNGRGRPAVEVWTAR
jgi:hypothetical protein